MTLSSLLDIGRGITAIVGGGGKTTLMHTLARELGAAGTVIVTTSTHIRVPTEYRVVTEPDAARIRRLLARDRAVCVGAPCEDGKLTAPVLSFAALSSLADHVLVEADGSRGLPLKAHAAHEPVLPEGAAQTILVVGADGFGCPIREVCHRPELYAQKTGVSTDTIVTPAIAARLLLAEGYGDRVFINKVESDEARAAARELAALLPCPTVLGSLWKGDIECWC